MHSLLVAMENKEIWTVIEKHIVGYRYGGTFAFILENENGTRKYISFNKNSRNIETIGIITVGDKVYWQPRKWDTDILYRIEEN
jgi:hypothetical protein